MPSLTYQKIVFRNEHAEIIDADLPAMRDDQLLVKTRCSLISPGTERAALTRLWDDAEFRENPGYALAGDVIAAGRDDHEIQEVLGADWLIYQDLPDLIEACREGNERIKQFDTSCFSGEYVTGVEDGYLEKLREQRSDKARKKRRHKSAVPIAV